MIDWDSFKASWIERVTLLPPPTRADTIKEGWRLYGDRFDYSDGSMILEHDLGVIEPIRFELVEYAAMTVIEAEGVIVARFPRLG